MMNLLAKMAQAGIEADSVSLIFITHAHQWTIRIRLIKVGALVRQSVRRVKVARSGSFPLQQVWEAWPTAR